MYLVSLWVSCEHLLEFGIPIGSFSSKFWYPYGSKFLAWSAHSYPLPEEEPTHPPPTATSTHPHPTPQPHPRGHMLLMAGYHGYIHWDGTWTVPITPHIFSYKYTKIYNAFSSDPSFVYPPLKALNIKGYICSLHSWNIWYKVIFSP